MDARKASSSSSPSSSSERWEYHIFLSFRGEDTRYGFTSHLHKALESRGYDVFMDEDDLQVGQVIKPELLQAIEKSKISVIVISTRYADSSWCLDELVKIMECSRTLNQIVLPIFYKVDPSHVRKQTGTLESDFKKHTIQHKDEVVKEWRKALTEAANLCAGVLEDRNEAKFIEAFIENNIVGRLSTTPLHVADYPVGVDSRVHDMISYLLGGGSQDVVMIGIWGMGGLGKTTAAKAIYNRIKDKFDSHCFLGDIRDTANRHGLVYLQKLLLAAIYKKRTIDISCDAGGKGMIQKELGRKRVLVIIDDVYEKEQLEALVGNRDWFGSGSRIIITTRDKHFLDVLRVNKTFTVPEMNPDEGLELFCRYAFEKGCPDKQYLELSKKVVFYSGGLPLALIVLGTFLVERTITEWESQLEELEAIPPKDILKILRISYDGLDDKEKCIFLDISCFFIGMNKDHVRKILDGCGFKAEIKISVLLQKCLVTVNEKNQLMMHDLLRDMGRAISLEGKPEDRSRLWLHEDVTDVLEDKSGTKKVEGLALNLPSSEKASFGTEAFSKMRKLKLLQLNYVELTGEYKFLSKNLRWLCWHGFLLDSIPGDFDLTSLIAMDLQFSKLKIVWKDCKLLEKLTIINLSHSHDLTTSPDFSKLPNLEELILEGCESLSEVHSSIGDLGRLSSVNLEDCEMLRELPLNFYKSKSIETLLLNGCRSFGKLAEDLGNLESLTTLKADYTAIRQIPSSLLKLKKLEVLSLFNVRLIDDTITNLFYRVKDLSNHLDIENSGSKGIVRMIGILGMGGIGKTTLAKAIYNKFEGSFEGRSFLSDVSAFANQRSNGLVGLQEQLLNDILKSKDRIKVDSVAKGIDMIRERLCCKRALVIIDNADDLLQLKAIAGARDWFGPGSRIVITTRNKHLLDLVEVDSTYMAKEMGEKEALALFSRHAFESGYPNQEYLDLSKLVIRYCRGLPLALVVQGSLLFKRSIAEWESHLEKLKISPDGHIQKIHRISFDGLPDRRMREIFLDISCFFIGMDKDYVTQILDGCGFFATTGIIVLIEQCLVTVSEQNKLMMHDLLRDMGREIVIENAHGRLEEFSRLWKREDVTDVLSDESGTKEIEGVALHLDLDLDSDLDLTRFSAQAFTNLKKLRLLHLSNVELTGEYKDFPEELIWLCWHYFPLESIPDDFPTQPKLVALDLQYSKLKIVWKDCKLHQNLKILNLSYSRRLTKSPDFSKLPSLEELILEGCESLSEVHSSIGDLGRLSLVNLEDCEMLKDLPLNFYQSKSIETLLLNGCRSFGMLAEDLGNMESLTTLKADYTAIRQIPSSILKLKKLKVFSLFNVKGSPSTNLLPPSLQRLSSLRELSLANWSLTDDAFPKDLGSLISLQKLDLASNDFCSLPSLSRLALLQDLSFDECKNLRAIPDLPTNLKVLKANGCIALEKMPDFSEMSNIRELYLRDSGKITEIPGLDKSLNSMTRIHMENCTNLTADFRKNILQGWTSCGYGGIFLSGNDIPDWFDCVHDDDIVYFTVPQSVGRILKGLTLSFVCSSDLYGCRISIKNMTKGTELEARIKPVCPNNGYYLWQGQLSNDVLKLRGDKVLIEIIVEDEDGWANAKVKKTGVSLVWDKFMNENMIDYHLCAYERRPYLVNDDDIIHVEDDNHIRKSPDLSKFPNLEKLIVKGCVNLYKVHSFIGDLGRLSLVNLEDCGSLEDLPLNFYKSKSIETLILNGCSSFHNLADGLGDMVSLTILKADNTAIRKIPSLAGLSKLKVLCLNACRELRAILDLPKNLHVLKANDCPELETIPDFSKMSNMRKLYLRDSVKLTEVPGLDKSLNSMTRIHMEGCTNLTADFRNNILQRWTSCGFGGIYLNGIYDIPEWFKFVNDVDNIVSFEVPQRIMGRDLKGLTVCFVYSSDRPKLEDSQGRIGIIVRNLTKQTALRTWIAFASVKTSSKPEDHYLWQGQLSNDVLGLEVGDRVSILVRPDDVDFVRVKKTGVHLEWDKVMKENMDNPDPHLYDLETNRDFSEGVDDAFLRGSVIHEQLAVEPYLDFFGGTDNELGWSHDASVPGDQMSAIVEDQQWKTILSAVADDGAGRSHHAFVRTNQSSVVDGQLAVEGCFGHLKSFLFNLFFNCFSHPR